MHLPLHHTSTPFFKKISDSPPSGNQNLLPPLKRGGAVYHEILLSKLDYYGSQVISYNWIKSYLNNCKQFVSLNGYDSGLAEINCGVPQSSVLAVPLFLLYINQAIKFGEVYHISDHTNLLYLGRSIKKLNKVVNLDLKTMLYWLSANKILLILKKLN